MAYVRSDGYDAPPLVQWRAVFAGAVIGLGVLILLSSLFAAIGFGTHTSALTGNFRWFEAGSAIFAMFLGAYFAAWFAGIRGFGSGLANAATLWGITVLAVVLVGIPSVMRIFNLRLAFLATTSPSGAVSTTGSSPHTVLWTAFFAIVIGLGAALLGGLFGGAMPRAYYAAPAAPVYDAPPREVPTTEYRRTG
jgi:hypothetical protein